MAGALVIAATARAADGGLAVTDSWMRMIMPSWPAAGYFTLVNGGVTARTLVGAASPACGTLMLHRTVQENGQERMVMVKAIPLPAHGKVAFAPDGYHLMCMGPAKEMVPGHRVAVTPRFADGGTLTADFPVRGVTGE